jgi:DNA-binding NarL/FixJ family response regulator
LLADELRTTAGMTVVGTAANATQALELARVAHPNVAVLDCAMRGGIDLIRSLTSGAVQLRVVVVGVEESERDIVACAAAGASGFVPLHAGLDDLRRGIRLVSRGEAVCSPRSSAILLRQFATSAPVVDPSRHAPLTAREWQVADLLRRGLANKEIALRLHIELPTVKNHVHHILDKLQVTSRAQAATSLLDDRVSRQQRRNVAVAR